MVGEYGVVYWFGHDFSVTNVQTMLVLIWTGRWNRSIGTLFVGESRKGRKYEFC